MEDLQRFFDLEPKGTRVDVMNWDEAVEVPEETLDKFRATDKNGNDITSRNFGIALRREEGGKDLIVRTSKEDGKTYIGPRK